MIYDERYRDQVFWDAPYSPDLHILINMIREKALNRTEIITPPAGKDLKTLGIGLGCTALLALAAGGITYLVTKVGLAAFIVGFISLFIGFTITAFLIARNRLLIRPKLMTAQVNAVCVGHSLTGGDGHMNRCPVFKYTYNGREYLAYDGNYTNRTKLPDVDEKLTIRIDPEDPAELMWSEGQNKNSFFFAVIVCAVLLLGEIGMIFVTLCDEGIMGG